MEQNNVLMEFKKAVDGLSGSPQEVYSSVWKSISEQEKNSQYNCFVFFMQEMNRPKINPISSTPETLNEGQSSLPVMPQVLQITDRIISTLTKTDLPIEEFYNALWEKINDSLLFPDDDSKAEFLFCLSIDQRIPYYQLGLGMEMQDPEFLNIANSITPVLKKAHFVVFRRLPQKTQEASLLMDLAEEINDYKKKVVFWAIVTTYIRARENVLKPLG